MKKRNKQEKRNREKKRRRKEKKQEKRENNADSGPDMAQTKKITEGDLQLIIEKEDGINQNGPVEA